MIEDIFLTYVNNSLRGNPEVFHKMYREFDKVIDDQKYPKYKERLTKIIDYFVTFVKTDDFEKAQKILKEESQNLMLERYEEYGIQHSAEDLEDWKICSREIAPEVLIAFEAVYGDRNDYCEAGGCRKFISRIVVFNRELLRWPTGFGCYNCDQMLFRKMLDGLIEGRDYFEIPAHFESEDYFVEIGDRKMIGEWRGNTTTRNGKDFYWIPDTQDFKIMPFLAKAPSTILNKRFRILSKEPPKTELVTVEKLQLSEEASPWKWFQEEDIKVTFCSIFLESMVAYSLSEFLLHNDRRKIKKCPYCQMVFIAKDIKRQRCYSENCRKEFEREKKIKQREKDPVKYL